MTSVFICHATKDLLYARKLYRDLGVLSFKIWLESETLFNEIEKTIQESSVLLVLLSKESVASQAPISRNVYLALRRLHHAKAKLLVIPVRLDEFDLTSTYITKIHWVDMFPCWNKGVSKLLDVIKQVPSATPRYELPKFTMDDEILKRGEFFPIILNIWPISDLDKIKEWLHLDENGSSE